MGEYIDGWMYSMLAEDYFLTIKGNSISMLVGEIDRKIIADIISETLNDKTISVNDDMHSIANWDSLSHINIILALQEKTGYKFLPLEISHAISVDAIYKIINSKNVI